jgi:SWI/SNF-related matrix-associated actin-dependent regulator 1 of chromatin subfamily A
VVIQGGMSAEEKQDAVNRFQNDPEVKVFIGGIKSAGTGLTLTAATHVLKNDWSFNPTDHLQSEDRAFRIGQKNAVLVTYISAKDTIDEKVEKIILPKFKAISKIVDGVDYQENEVMGELIKMIEDSLK